MSIHQCRCCRCNDYRRARLLLYAKSKYRYCGTSLCHGGDTVLKYMRLQYTFCRPVYHVCGSGLQISVLQYSISSMHMVSRQHHAHKKSYLDFLELAIRIYLSHRCALLLTLCPSRRPRDIGSEKEEAATAINDAPKSLGTDCVELRLT